MKKLLYLLFHRSVLGGLALLAQIGILAAMVLTFSEYTQIFYWCCILASVAAAELAGAGRFGMSAHQAARTASQCGEALQNMNRNLNQKLLLTLLAARIAR